MLEYEIKFPISSTKLIKSMEVGETKIVTESKSKNFGSRTQTYALRANSKVIARKCHVIIPHSDTMLTAIIVTKISEIGP